MRSAYFGLGSILAWISGFILLSCNVNAISPVSYQQPEEVVIDSVTVSALIPSDSIPSGGNRFIFKGDNPWLSRVNYFGRSFALVDLLIMVIILSIGTMLILLLVILLNRRRMEKEEKLYQYLLEAYQELIIEYLYGDIKLSQFLDIANDSYRRQVLIDQMKDVAINLRGGAEKKLDELYLNLGLEKDSIKKAYDKRWHIKIKGFRELAFMNIKVANEEMYRCLNSRNEILRMEAQIALVRLSDDNPFEFLYYLRRPFSLWEQITLHEMLIQHSLNVPPFRQWLDSPNYTIVMFSLRMVRELKQMDAEEDMLSVLKHSSDEVRNLAIQVAGDLQMGSTREMMKRMYKHEPYANCLEILRSIGKMPDVSMLGFLKLVLDKEDDVQLQIEATKSIENIGEEGVSALVKLMKSEYKNYNIIIRHVLDRRIY